MLARTFTLAIVAALSATGLAWSGDGEDIRFAEIKAINEDKFKKTKFNVHDATEHDKNFNQVEAKDRDVLKVVDFRKDEDDFGRFDRFGGGKHDFYRRDFGDNDYYRGDGGKFGHGRKGKGGYGGGYGGRKGGDFKHRKGGDFKHRPFKGGKDHGFKGKHGDY